MSGIVVKTGDDFDLACELEGVDLTTVTIRMQVRKISGATSTLISTIGITKDPDQVTNVGKYRAFKAHGDADGSSVWPEGALVTDIEYTIGGVVSHTETLDVLVRRAVTV